MRGYPFAGTSMWTATMSYDFTHSADEELQEELAVVDDRRI